MIMVFMKRESCVKTQCGCGATLELQAAGCRDTLCVKRHARETQQFSKTTHAFTHPVCPRGDCTATGDALDLNSPYDKYVSYTYCVLEPSTLLCSALFHAEAFCFMPSRQTTLLCFAGAECLLHLLHCPVCLCV